MLILEEFTNSWNYTFIIVALGAILIGTIITLRKIRKQEMNERRDKRNNNHIEKETK